jgi:16S rRNA (uracil1498-N3)-methyltransferase
MEAAKQCNRGSIPIVEPPVDFTRAVRQAAGSELCIIPYENEKGMRLADVFRSGTYKKISIVIGPEGGFSDTEIEKARKSGVIPVSLGPRILRTETAALAVISITMYQVGDVG